MILLLALVVLGPEKLPDAIRRAGRTYAELKRMGNSFQDEVRSVLDEPAKEMRETADLLRTTVNDTASTVKGAAAKPTPARRAATRPVTPPPQTAEPASRRRSSTAPDEELINRTLSGDSAPKPDEHPAP